MKQVYFSVTNDLSGDQRVHRIISTLQKSGASIHLIGRRLRGSHPLSSRDYSTLRFRMLFNKGFLFYAFYNIRLFLYLLTRKKIDVLVANDLDTLPANYLVSRIRKTELFYDSHEYFTESPELLNRENVKNFWLWLEKRMVPFVSHAYTVSHSIADEYNKKYEVRFGVVRNFPSPNKMANLVPIPFNPGEKKILIYQGSLNIGRGLELIIDSVKGIENVIFLIVGDGDIRNKLEYYVNAESLSDKIYFMGKIPFEKLHSITMQADAGVSFEEDLGLNYKFALPNKLFDYIHAKIPVLVSSLPEMAGIVTDYNIGIVGGVRNVEHVRQNIRELLFDNKKRAIWKKNLINAANELSWEKEEKVLLDIYFPFI